MDEKNPVTKSSSNESERTESGPSITTELVTFVQHIESLVTSLPIVMRAIQTSTKDAAKQFFGFLQTRGTLTSETEDKMVFELASEDAFEAERLKRSFENLKHGSKIIPQIFVVSLVSQYDAFLGRLIRCLFFMQPDLLTASEKNLSFAKLLELNSIENAREYMIEKEVESVLRKSHTDQFDWLEHKFGLPLRKDLPIWPTFIEVTERRNLLVHCNGVVSSQYLSVCKQNDVKMPETLKVGDQLDVSSKYLSKAYRCIFEIGVKLEQVLWRKVKSDELSEADESLSSICYDLISRRQYILAATLLDFATETLKKHSSEDSRRVFIINRAQAHKWGVNGDACQAILKKEDWSACSDKFKIALAVLSDDFQLAVSLMKRFGPAGEVTETNYKEWPLFKEFRKSDDFLKAYEEVFGKPFRKVEQVPKAEDARSDSKPPETEAALD